MADKTVHLIYGAAFGIAFLLITRILWGWFPGMNLKSTAIILVILYVYSLLADIDSKSSTIVYSFLGVSAVALGSGYLLDNRFYLLFGIILMTATVLAAQFLPHRGFAHSILFGLFTSIPLMYYISWQYSLLAFVCYYSHLVADEEWFKMV